MSNVTLWETVQMWEMQNNTPFWDDIQLHKAIDKDALIDYLLYEFSDMRCIDSNSGAFRNHVSNFFKIHKWNIDKLADTLELEYYTLENVRYHKHNKTDAEKNTISERGIVGAEDVKVDKNTVWDEDGSEDRTAVHFVSAFNDVPSPTSTNPPVYKDTEQYRDTSHMSYQKDGSETNSEKTDKDTTEDENFTSVVTDDIHTDNDKVGHDGGSYQSLIEEERKQAQFNIYKWIGKHFVRELLVAIY